MESLREELEAANGKHELLAASRAAGAKQLNGLEEALRTERVLLEQLRNDLGSLQLRDREQELETRTSGAVNRRAARSRSTESRSRASTRCRCRVRSARSGWPS